MKDLIYRIYSNGQLIEKNLSYHKMIYYVDTLIYTQKQRWLLIIGHNIEEDYDIPVFTYTGNNQEEWEDMKNKKVKIMESWK